MSFGERAATIADAPSLRLGGRPQRGERKVEAGRKERRATHVHVNHNPKHDEQVTQWFKKDSTPPSTTPCSLVFFRQAVTAGGGPFFHFFSLSPVTITAISAPAENVRERRCTLLFLCRQNRLEPQAHQAILVRTHDGCLICSVYGRIVFDGGGPYVIPHGRCDFYICFCFCGAIGGVLLAETD